MKKSCDPGLCLRGVYSVFDRERNQATDEERPHIPMNETKQFNLYLIVFLISSLQLLINRGQSISFCSGPINIQHGFTLDPLFI